MLLGPCASQEKNLSLLLQLEVKPLIHGCSTMPPQCSKAPGGAAELGKPVPSQQEAAFCDEEMKRVACNALDIKPKAH